MALTMALHCTRAPAVFMTNVGWIAIVSIIYAPNAYRGSPGGIGVLYLLLNKPRRSYTV